jgi:hypothetical protein
MNPLKVQFWLWGQDVLRGDLEQRGFAKHPSALGAKGSVYIKKELTLYASGAKLVLGTNTLCYARANDGFSWLCGEQACVQQGLELLYPHVLEHEMWILDKYGATYRRKLLKRPPPNVRREIQGWHVWLGV